MIAEFSLVQAAVTVVFGAIAGGVTNAVAIWMLFHPYAPRGVGWLRFQGALPKNKARLAKTIGRTVGQRLLTSDDLLTQLRTPGMRQAFDDTVGDLLRTVLEGERGALRASLPESARGELDRIVERVAQAVGDRAAPFVRTEQFRTSLTGFLTKARDELADRPIADVLTEARRTAIRERVEGWVADAAASDEVEHTIRDWLDRQVERLAADASPLLDRFSPDLVAAVERAIAGYLPVAIDHLARAVRDPATRQRLEHALHELFERFARDLLIHQRIVARLVVTERTFTKLLDSFEREGADELGRLIEEPTVRDQIARRINEAVVQFLQRPLAEHAARLGPERLAGLTATAARHLVTALRDPATRAYAVDRLDRALQAAEKRTWGDLLQHLPPERAASWIAEAADTPRLREWIAGGARSALDALLDQPLGRPTDWLGDDAADRVAGVLGPALWEWIEAQLPTVVARLDVQSTVEQKVLGFSLRRMEEIVRATTQRELDLIVRLGYVLGAIVGALAYGVGMVLG